MQLLNLFIYSKSHFYMYKLQAGEVLVLHNNNQHKSYIILDGNLIVSKHFKNNKVISIDLLRTTDILSLAIHNELSTNYFYKAQALCTTYIFSCSNYFTNKFIKIIKPQFNNKLNYLLEISAHRNAKQRLVHTLLILTKLYGTINNKKFVINLHISYDILSSITGSNKNTISILIRQLTKHKIIIYSKHKITINNIVKLTQY